ncbi:hypothetical protein DHC50_03875 [Arenibacter sp. A80]|nr:hypothetical protein [Arenibacter sp. A80]RFT58288.1 hypothetical protein D0S24_03875 [Arenibacter sp. P308M17]
MSSGRQKPKANGNSAVYVWSSGVETLVSPWPKANSQWPEANSHELKKEKRRQRPIASSQWQ